MSVQQPAIVLHYRQRADSFYGAARDLELLDAEAHGPAVGLLSVHSCIALADALLVAVEGRRTKAEDHGEAARRLREWCAARRIPEGGLKHFEWLLGRKTHFSYDARPVSNEDLQLAKVKMDQFFTWAFRSFPAVAQISGADNA